MLFRQPIPLALAPERIQDLDTHVTIDMEDLSSENYTKYWKKWKKI